MTAWRGDCQITGVDLMHAVYGYTIADTANEGVFSAAAEFITHTLHYKPSGSVLKDVDGSLYQAFSNDSKELWLESSCEIDCVVIRSEVELPIKCLRKWTDVKQ